MEISNKIDILETLGSNIRKIRLMKGFSQESLADTINKSVNFVSLVENGKTGLSVQTLIDFCNSLGVDMNTLFNGIVKPIESKDSDFLLKSFILLNEKDKTLLNDIITYMVNSKS